MSQQFPVTSPRRLVSAEAEAAIAQITSRLADHRYLVEIDASTAPVRGRGVAQSRLTRHSNAFVDLVSVAESFASARLLRMHPDVSYDELSNWRKREKAWDKHCSVKLSDYAQWRQLKGFVEVRNAIQHGLGRLTDQQLGKYRDEILASIRDSAVELNGDLLIVISADVDRCGQVCRGFVRWLDSSASTS